MMPSFLADLRRGFAGVTLLCCAALALA